MHLIYCSILFSWLLLLIGATEYNGCIGDDYSCGDKVELFPADSLTLTMNDHESSYSSWQDRIVIVRRSEQSYDVCTGCTLSIRFVSIDTSTSMTVTLSEANYSTDSYYSSETVLLSPLAVVGDYKDLSHKTINSTGTVVKLSFDNIYSYKGDLKIVITPNIPPENIDVGLILAIAIPLTVLFIAFNIVVYKLRQRRTRRLRAALEARVTAMVVDAAIDAAMLRQLRARQGRGPHSPDPTESVAPPSYMEASGPPKYDDVVREGSIPQVHTTTISPEGPDNGRDTDMLVV